LIAAIVAAARTNFYDNGAIIATAVSIGQGAIFRRKKNSK